MLGTGFTDLDLVGQAYAKGEAGDQWARAFGLSYFAEQLPLSESPGYKAYRQVRDDQPSQLVDILYYQLYALVIGIQMAGPELTPENFETGMFAYPGRHRRRRHVGLHARALQRRRSTPARSGWTRPRRSPFNSEPGHLPQQRHPLPPGRVARGRPGGLRVSEPPRSNAAGCSRASAWSALLGLTVVCRGQPGVPLASCCAGRSSASATACWPWAWSSPTAPPASSTSPTAPWAAWAAAWPRRSPSARACRGRRRRARHRPRRAGGRR